MKTKFLKKLSSLALSAAMVAGSFIGFAAPTSAAGALSDVAVTLGDNVVGHATTSTSISYTTVTALSAGDSIVLDVSDAFTTAADGAVTGVTVNGTAATSATASTNGTQKVLTIELADAVAAATTTIVADSWITTNPASGGSYNVNVTTKTAAGVIQDQGSGIAGIVAGDLTATSVNLENTAPSAATGAATLGFTVENEIPVGGDIIIAIPDATESAFVANDIADLTTNITGFTDDATDISANISAADLTGNVITITLQTAAIAAGSVLEISFDNTVIDTNPTAAGEYALGLSTQDASNATIDMGNAIGYIDNQVTITAVVQEALIMTLDSTDVNLIVDPSVNNGQDNSKSNTLTVKTNANGYVINAQFSNAKNDENGLHYFDGTTDHYIENNTNALATNNDNYFGFNTTAQGDLADQYFTTATPSTIFTQTAPAKTNGRDHTLYYDINVDYTSQAGVYGGVITYTAIPSF